MLDPHKILIIDLEGTCWRNHAAPEGERSEIIQIGAALLNLETLQPEQKNSILVKPIHSTVGEFCTKLTGLTQADVEQGLSFAEACQALAELYPLTEIAWGSWGMYDFRTFHRQCKKRDVPYPFSSAYRNIKQLFALTLNGKRMGLSAAMTHANLSFIGQLHRGDDDAWNIARVTAWLVEKYGISILGLQPAAYLGSPPPKNPEA